MKHARLKKMNRDRLVIDASDWRRLHRSGNPAKILADAELRAFVDERLPVMTFSRLAAACLEKFGPDRAAGRTAIHHYWQSAVRPQLEPRPKKSGTKRGVKRRWPRTARSRAVASDA